MVNGSVQRAAQLRVAGAFLASLRMCRPLVLVLPLFREHVRERMRGAALLGEQQGQGEEQRQEQAGRSHGGVTLAKAGRSGKRCRGA